VVGPISVACAYAAFVAERSTINIVSHPRCARSTQTSHFITAPMPAPAKPLTYRRILSPTGGIRVSPLCLGGMSLGKAWSGASDTIQADP
jgi:hypothetical protein